MKFWEALKAMEEGKKITNKHYLARGEYLFTTKDRNGWNALTRHNVTPSEKESDETIDFVDGKQIFEDEWEEYKEVLTNEEKGYLECVLGPFKDRTTNIEKQESYDKNEFILITAKSLDGSLVFLEFPNFEKGKYYKGMELHKKYTIDDLKLFKR